jgi:hypothetical protein
MPSFLRVRMIRVAIAPRLAINTRLNMVVLWLGWVVPE